MIVHVQCYSGYRAEQTPRAFRLGANQVGVRSVMDQWIGEDHRYFKVLGDDEATYILRHDTVSDVWELTFYKRKDVDGPGIMMAAGD